MNQPIKVFGVHDYEDESVTLVFVTEPATPNLDQCYMYDPKCGHTSGDPGYVHWQRKVEPLSHTRPATKEATVEALRRYYNMTEDYQDPHFSFDNYLVVGFPGRTKLAQYAEERRRNQYHLHPEGADHGA